MTDFLLDMLAIAFSLATSAVAGAAAFALSMILLDRMFARGRFNKDYLAVICVTIAALVSMATLTLQVEVFGVGA